MKLSHEILTVHTKHPFIIARGGSSEYKTVWVRVSDGDGAEGWGEAAPSKFYGETPETVVAALARLAPVVERADAWSLDAIEAGMNKAIGRNGSAKSAVSAALHDLAAKRLGIPLWKLWGLDPTASPKSSYTIAIAPDDATLRARITEAAQYPILKVKLGTDHDEEIIRTVRSTAPEKILRVDANAAWTPKRALRMVDLCRELGVEFVEQPLPAQDIEGLRFVRERASLPIIADESCVVATDIPKLVGVVDGINIKLSKCGGLREALTMIAVARTHGMLVMCGCMIETTLGIAAAAHFAPLLDCADLDGAALLSDDPFTGPGISRGTIGLSAGPGLGVGRKSAETKAKA
jgi:L-alanine-DL-glutamate epimerase-like enolase superfamily enzyme